MLFDNGVPTCSYTAAVGFVVVYSVGVGVGDDIVDCC